MEIYILRDGKEAGPYSEEDTQRMLKQGDVRITDLAWKKGMQEWIPLHSVLYPAPEAATPAQEVAATAAPLSVPAEPATAKQKAFLNYVGVRHEAGITKEQAAMLVNEAMENPREPARIARWNVDRLKLHPDLFAEEIQARKEQRTARFFDLTQTEGAKCVEGVTKAHCQVLVNYLDVKFPHWDANETEALWNFFLPAVAEKFPQLVRKEWKDKLKFPQGPKVAPELKRRPVVAAKVKRPSPLALVARGMAITLIVIGLAIGAIYLQRHPEERAKLRLQGEALIAKFSKSASRGTSIKTPSQSSPTVGTSEATPSVPEVNAPEAPANTAATAVPEAPAPAAPPVASTAPAAEMPAAPASTGSTESLFGPPTTPPSAMSGDPAMAPADATASLLPGPKTHVTLIEPVKIETPYGPMEFRRGMTFPLVSQEGVDVTVRFQGRIIDIP
ncbi:MAG: GYF domain-containing protein, partial [Chthoniobacteraceae bacterium]